MSQPNPKSDCETVKQVCNDMRVEPKLQQLTGETQK